jgi:hypothetical protein
VEAAVMWCLEAVEILAAWCDEEAEVMRRLSQKRVMYHGDFKEVMELRRRSGKGCGNEEGRTDRRRRHLKPKDYSRHWSVRLDALAELVKETMMKVRASEVRALRAS